MSTKRFPAIPILSNPVLLDYALLEIQNQLIIKLAWLNHAFGKAQTLKRKDKSLIPSVYTGTQEYLPAFPDSHLGNFCFFKDNGSDLTVFQNIDFETDVSCIFWFDYQKVYTDWELATIENVKLDILNAFKTMRLTSTRVEIVSFSESDIYKGYTDKEIENQFLMRPYGGIRIDLKVKYLDKKRCDV